MSDRGYTVRVRGTSVGLVVRAWRCPAGHRFDDTIERSEPHAPRPCACGALAEPTLSAPRFKPQRGYVHTGASQEAPPLAMDCTKLADGMDPDEWRADLDSRVHAAEMDALKRGGAL